MDNGDLLKQLHIDRTRMESHNNTRRWSRFLVVLGLLIVLIGVGAWWMTKHHAITVQTAVAVTPNADASAVLQATGYVTARRQATVSAQITGTLTAVLIEEGDHVRKDQVLARLDDSAYKAGLVSAKAQAASASALVAQYRAQLAQNLRDAAREQSLAAQGLVSKQDAEQVGTQADATRAQLVSQEKTAASVDAQVTQAQVNFDYCVVRAPFDGVITTKDAQVGEIVSPLSAGGGFTRTGIGTVVDMDSLEVDVDVNEAYIGRVQPGMPAEAVLDAYPDWKIPARVIAIVPTADRSKATVKVRVALEKKDARIVPDMGVRVAFLEQKATSSAPLPKGVLVPTKAITQRDGQSVVFLVVDSKAKQIVVKPIAQTDADMKWLPDLLQPGDPIVLSPTSDLHDGSDIQVSTAKP